MNEIDNKPLVSVIVPIYNAEAFLHASVDSILAQTLSNIEVILVDDGSKDNSGRICDEYVTKDFRVRVIHQNNSGVSMARKKGIDSARADWIYTFDADDTLPSSALEDLYKESIGSDIVIGRDDDKKYEKDFLSPEEYKSCVITKKYARNYMWLRLIKRSLFNDSIFPSRYFVCGEDALMNLALAFENKKPVRLLSKNVFNYNIRQDSISHTFKSSLEYEEKFNKKILEIIPIEQRVRYLKECVFLRLERLELLYIAYKRNVWYGTPYYKDLIEQANSCGYHIHLSQWLKLRITNPTLLRLYMSAECFFTYRFGKLKEAFSHHHL